MLEWSDVRNMKIVYQKMFLDTRNTVKRFFPLKFQPVEFHVRHGGDPLLAALDINRNLDFGLTQIDKRAQGTATLVFSIITLICGLWRSKTVLCPQYDIFKHTSQALFEKDLEKYQKRISRYRVDEPDQDDFKW